MKKEYKTIQPEEYHLLKQFSANREVEFLKNGGLKKSRQTIFNSLKEDDQYSDVICCWRNLPEGRFLMIIDGQHRSNYLKLIKKPIDIKILSKDDGSDLNNEEIDKAIRVLNALTINWKNPEYLRWGKRWNKNPYIDQFSIFKEKYKFIDINVLGTIVTGEPKYNIKERISSLTLRFDLEEENIQKLTLLLEAINECSATLLLKRKNHKIKGLRKVTINNALIRLFKEKGYIIDEINRVFSNNYDKFLVDDSIAFLNALKRYLN